MPRERYEDDEYNERGGLFAAQEARPFVPREDVPEELAAYDRRHPHEPEIAPALADDGHCRVCRLMVRLDEARAQAEALASTLHDARAWCVDGANAIEPRNVLGQVVAVADEALRAYRSSQESSDAT